MEVDKAATLARHRAALVAAAPWTSAALTALERDRFRLTHIRAHKRFVWFVWVTPPEDLQEGFGLAPELLVVLVDMKLQATDLRAAAEEVFSAGRRLDGNLMVVSDRFSAPLQPRLNRIGGHGQRIAWNPDALGVWPSLTGVLRDALPTFDAYEERDPVRGAQLVGRDAEVSELRTRIDRGDAVGLFGLRKMGKTSVLRAVTDVIDPASGVRDGHVELPAGGDVAVVLDAGVLVERGVDALAEELLGVLSRRMQAAKEPVPERRGSGLAAWKSAVESLLDAGRRVCVAIDEYDLLFEGEGGEGPVPGLNRLFRLLRAWSQMRQGQASLVLVGRDATFLSTPELDGVTNSLLLWSKPMWLGPLALEPAALLLRQIGQRVGLSVGSESAREAFEWTGGHPLLHRQFGSALRGATREGDATWGAATDRFSSSALVRYRDRDAVLEVLREVVALLRKRYPEGYDLFRDLAEGYSWDDVVTGHSGEAARTLSNFGLLRSDHTIAETYRWYLNQLAPSAPPLKQTG